MENEISSCLSLLFGDFKRILSKHGKVNSAFSLRGESILEQSAAPIYSRGCSDFIFSFPVGEHTLAFSGVAVTEGDFVDKQLEFCVMDVLQFTED